MTTIRQPHIRGNDLARFERSYEPNDDGCWIFKQCKSGGYGLFFAKGKHRAAHRWSYEQFVGPIPDGYVIDHLCKVRPCVNPEHLEAVPPRENQRRKAVQVCIRGHDLNDPAVVYVHGGSRHCRPCRRQNMADRRASDQDYVQNPQPRTECKRGHDLTDSANVYEYRGSKLCRPCRTIAQKRYGANRKDR